MVHGACEANPDDFSSRPLPAGAKAGTMNVKWTAADIAMVILLLLGAAAALYIAWRSSPWP